MVRTQRHILPVILAVLSAVLLMPSCSTKKNTAASRKYQAFITRYNVYFNGDEHFRETLKSMEQSYEDDYSDILFTHPADAKADPKAPQPSGDFNRSIEKAQKAIQLHSIKKKPRRKSGRGSDPAYKAWLKRDEYNPFLHNAWMMMGRSQYFNGDFLGAASTFYYVTKHFTWLPATVTEARLWQARSYVALDWLYEAEILINRTKPADLTTSSLRNLYDFVSADYYVRSRQFDLAAPYLESAAKAAKGSQKPRLYFLLGQVYSRLGMKEKAYNAFHKAGSSPGVPYRTKFNTRIRQSEVFAGADITSEVNALRRMTRYDRNKDYLDQVYYAIGNLYLSRGDTLHAIENYIIAADKSTRNGIDKAISQITLGGLYFDRGEYDLAPAALRRGSAAAARGLSRLSESEAAQRRTRRTGRVLAQRAAAGFAAEAGGNGLHRAHDGDKPHHRGSQPQGTRGGRTRQARRVSRTAGSQRHRPCQQRQRPGIVPAQHRRFMVFLQPGHLSRRTVGLPAAVGQPQARG